MLLYLNKWPDSRTVFFLVKRPIVEFHKYFTIKVIIEMIHINVPRLIVILYPFSLLRRDSIPLIINTIPTNIVIRNDIKDKSVFQRTKLMTLKTVAVNAINTSTNKKGFFRSFQIENISFCF